MRVDESLFERPVETTTSYRYARGFFVRVLLLRDGVDANDISMRFQWEANDNDNQMKSE